MEPTENQCDWTATPMLAGGGIARDDGVGVHERIGEADPPERKTEERQGQKRASHGHDDNI